MDNINIKILVGYHKPAKLIKDNIFIPIHLGRSVANNASYSGVIDSSDLNWLKNNLIGDDTGENISHLNRFFCEMTGIYWAWKNYDKLDNPDYFGFMHYKRFLIFDPTIESFTLYANTIYNLLNKINYSENNIKNLLSQSNVLLGSPDIHNNISVYNQYKNSRYHIIDDLDSVDNYIRQYYSEYTASMEKYLNGNSLLFCNLFILKKDIFFQYCEWIFNILFHIHKDINYTKRNVHESRAIGFLSERLTGIFFHKYLSSNNNCIFLPKLFLNNTDIQVSICEKKTDDPVMIFFSTDDNYIPYLAVAIQSIIENTTKNYNYEINIIYETLDRLNIKKINLLNTKPNVKINFINIDHHIKKFTFNLVESLWYTKSIYFRMLASDIFKEYNKIIYLDCDVIVLSDIAELFYCSLDNKLLGAIKDIEVARWIKSSEKKQSTKKFLTSLEIYNHTLYFNSGVLVMNLEKMREQDISHKLITFLKEKTKKGWIGDQDIFNSVCYNDVKYFPINWNLEWIVNLTVNDYCIELDEVDANSYLLALKDIKILHYCDQYKPWNYPKLPLANIWWKYAKNTVFFEELLFSLEEKNNAITTI